ncbi:N/A [soil metagenome]
MPEDLAGLVAGGVWDQVWAKPGGQVWRVVGPDERVRFVKVGTGAEAAEVVAEQVRLRWLSGRAGAPLLVGGAPDLDGADLDGAGFDGDAYLVTEARPGLPAHAAEHRFEVGAVLDGLAAAVAGVHRLVVADCPFDRRLAVTLPAARDRVGAGLVDPDELDPAYRRHTPAELFALLEAARPNHEEDLVVCHGDPCLPNVLLAPGAAQVTGVVDWGRGGVGDRYLYLAPATRSVAANLGAELVHRFFDAYHRHAGLDGSPDPQRFDFYVLLDEFF